MKRAAFSATATCETVRGLHTRIEIRRQMYMDRFSSPNLLDNAHLS
jgi:hypothetical protein